MYRKHDDILAPMTLLHLLLKIEGHLAHARRGDRDRESRLITRVCEIRKSAPDFSSLPPELQDAVRRSLEFLVSVGRRVEFDIPDEHYWVSRRGGAPRYLA